MAKPALRTLFPYVIGILLASYLDLHFLLSFVLTIILLISAIFFFCQKRSKTVNFLLILAIFSLGVFRYHFAVKPIIPVTLFEQNVHFKGHVTYHPESQELLVHGKIEPLVGKNYPKIKGNFLVKTREHPNLHYGDIIEFNGVLRKPPGKRNPGGFDYRAYLLRKGIQAIIYPWQSAKLSPKAYNGHFAIVLLDKIREKVEQVIDKCVFKHSDIVKAIILGKRQLLPDTLTEKFKRSGVFHILAVSGLHVGLIATACFAFLSLFRIPQKFVCSITICLVIIYAGIVGFRPSVIRAALIIVLYLFARIIDRDSDILNLLAISALVILLINPTMLWDVGFQLTFIVTASIVYLLPKWELVFHQKSNLWKFYHSLTGKFILVPILVTLSAQIASQPLIAHYFNRIYISSFLSNLPVALLTWYITSVSFATIIGGLIWQPIGQLFGYATFPAIELLLKAINFFSNIPFAEIKVNTPKFVFFVLYISIFFAVINWRWLWCEKRKTIAIACIIILICITYWTFQPSKKLLQVTFLDVGQGDSIFVHLPDGRNLLFDGGMKTSNYDAGEMVLEPFLRYYGTGKIDAVILTHPHNDHAGGLFHILENFKVDHFVARDRVNQKDLIYEKLCEIAEENRIELIDNTKRLSMDSDIIQIEFMPELKISSNEPESDANNNSIVLKICYGKMIFLFTGDIEAEAEQKLINLGIDLNADVLKAPHHGSITSSTERFVRTVNPKYVIFNVGVRNRFGFPSPIVTNRYRKLGAEIFRTDRDGAITFYTDGKRTWIKRSR